MQYFAAAFSGAEYFVSRFNLTGKLKMPVMVPGGEASFAPETFRVAAFAPIVANLTTAVVPKAAS